MMQRFCTILATAAGALLLGVSLPAAADQPSCAEAAGTPDMADLNGDPDAMIALAAQLAKGECRDADPKRAVELLRVAASYNRPDAHAVLGNFYADGLLGEVNHQRAYLHWSQAARGGVVPYARLGQAHYAGQGVPRDVEAAEAILSQGAARGDEASRRALRAIYLDEGGELYAPDKAARLADD
ncbi:MAG: sel1 repeat family protein [Gammaproteobacteria bacterium]|nr:sel1 repeat family protein [Gammaproteobacteria bacterium]